MTETLSIAQTSQAIHWIRLLPYVPMLVLLFWAGFEDLRSRRIPNLLVVCLMCTGFLQSFFASGTVTPGSSAIGFVVGFFLPFALFAIGALGAGDVKLLAGMGTWLGGPRIAMIFVLEAVIGLVIVLAQAIWQRRTRQLLRNSALVVLNLVHLKEVGVEHVSETGRACRSVERPLPYAVPVLIATLMVLTGNVWPF